VDQPATGVPDRGADPACRGSDPPASETDGSLVADVAFPATSFTDTGLTPATQYSYTLFAHDGTPVYAAGATLTTSTK
jgi:chitodextrinase